MTIFTQLFATLFPSYTWIKQTKDKVVYLTFDDGPIPEITEWVLDVLQTENIKATFFCIGDNIRKHPTVFNRIVNDAHQVANHTFNHLKGWATTTEDYIVNFELCQAEILAQSGLATTLFRPPYGKIKHAQAKRLKAKGIEIVMWSVLTKDYDQSISEEECLHNALSGIKPGTIIVFHDSIKAAKNMKYALPKTIKALKEQGYRFKTL